VSVKRLTAALATAAALLLSGTCLPEAEAATEKIGRFHSSITVNPDASLTVTETITVTAAGQKIKRGIYRTFPTEYTDRLGRRVVVPFEVLEAERDGRPEPWHVKREANGVRVYLGKSSVFLEPGEYTYALTYRTDRQIGYFDGYDELYWNVTGNDWEFTIEEVVAEVFLPPGADVVNTAAYTGREGAKGKDFTFRRRPEGGADFSTTRALMPREGLTVAVSWPKGYVREPDRNEQAANFLRDNRSAAAALAGLLVLLAYYAASWLRVGRDPPEGVIVPRYEPPEGYSPAAVRFSMRMGYSDRAFAAAVVSMAVKGCVTIEDDGGSFTVSRTGADDSVLSKGEKRIAGKLFGSSGSIELKSRNHKRIKEAIEALKKSLRADFELLNFRRNGKLIVPGIVLTLLTLASVVLTAGETGGALFITFWLTMWTMGCYGLFSRVVRSWRAGLAGRGGAAALNLAGAVFATLFALPFFFGEVAGFVMFSRATSFSTAVLFLLVVVANLVFKDLLKAPTLHGRRIMDKIEGFRTYLAAAEGDRMDRLNPPEKTPKLFEKYLPYALALDVENAWSEKFGDVLARAAAGGEYRPAWYSGGRLDSFSTQGMASSLGSAFAGAISSSSTAPGSSSGSGGGGSSGGGGGGGGGGGW
jgi:uncharacterized membrane protein YgcG